MTASRDQLIEYIAVLEELQRRAAAKDISKWFPDESNEAKGVFGRLLYPKHMTFFDAGKDYNERAFIAANRVGKAQPNDEPVLTPDGYRPMGDLQVGDYVIGSNGKPTKVVSVHPQGMRRVVRLLASDGSWTRCDLEHLWSVRPVKDGKDSIYQTMTALELRERIANGERWMLPERPVAEMSNRLELPVDPYLVGLLIGDGGLSTDTVVLTSADDEIVRYCQRIAPAYGCEFVKRGDLTYQFATKIRKSGRHLNVLAELLNGLGLRWKLSKDKRIPPEYMTASPLARLALLRGLMDTDGSCGTNGARAYYSVSKELCEDVAELARSLGIGASVLQKNGLYRKQRHVSWKVGLARSELSVFGLARKREREIFTGRTVRGIMVDAVFDDGIAQCTCITVEAPDHLYLTRHCIVTHNSIAGGFESAVHATGLYPHWWNGWKLDRPIRGWCCGKTTETTRDIVQVVLFGPTDSFGSGMIPKRLIGEVKTRPNTNGGLDYVHVKNEKTGNWGRLAFKAFEQGRRAFEGTEQDWVWGDEEMPADIYTECLTRTATTNGRLVLTFTPLDGVTELVHQFLADGIKVA